MVKTNNKLKSSNNPKNKISQRHISNSKKPSSKNVSNNRRFNNKSKFSGKSHLNKANLRNMKAIKKERFLQKKDAKTKLSIKQEEEINNLENERDLFDEDGFYKIDEEVNENEWEENDLLAGKTITLGDSLFNKMTNVEQRKFDPRVVDAYNVVGNILSTYVSGKLPKAFNILPSTENWEDLIQLTKPFNWSPQATYEATIMFSSNFGSDLAEKFYSKVLLPIVRNNIKTHKKLNIHYYNCLKKAIFKPSAFFKGIIFPLSENLTSKEAAIIGSILKKCSIPVTHSSACIMKLTTMKPGMGVLFFIRSMLLKKYAIPTKVKECLVKYFHGFIKSPEEKMPVVWHQILLTFVQFYKFDLNDGEKDLIREVVSKKHHHMISEDIYRELSYKAPTLGNLKSLNTTQINMKID
jgi:essential nuclear protein 1